MPPGERVVSVWHELADSVTEVSAVIKRSRVQFRGIDVDSIETFIRVDRIYDNRAARFRSYVSAYQVVSEATRRRCRRESILDLARSGPVGLRHVYYGEHA